MRCFPDRPNPEKEKLKELDRCSKQIFKEFTKTINLLLLGTGESGKTTILKQMRILHINGFSEEEKIAKIPFIKQNIHESLHSMIEASLRINPPVEIRNERTRESAEYFSVWGNTKPETWTDEYVGHVKRLWTDPDIQTIFQRSNEYQLIDSAQHFLDKVDDVNKDDYIPTVQDILFCRITTTAITRIQFDVQVPKAMGGGVANFCMYDVGGQRGHRRKWITVFDGGIQAILFLIAASDFDQMLREDENVNRLKESLKVFEDIFWSRFVRDAGFIVFLNKQDLLKKKIESGRRIENYFPDYVDFPANENEYERAKHYLKQKIIEASNPKKSVEYFMKDVPMTINDEREAYIHFTTATDTNNIRTVFEDVHKLIFNRNIDKLGNVY